MEAKWSFITLLSHPKTWVGNMMGGSHNTIANAGLDNFVDASFDKKKLLNTVFRETRLGDGTKITTPEHLRRFAEESGALETFYVTEASLERRFTGKEAKEFMKGRLNMRLEASRSIASFLGFLQLIKKKIQAYEEIADLIDSVTLEEINLVLEDIFKPDNFVLSIVGPVKDTDIFQDKMNL